MGRCVTSRASARCQRSRCVTGVDTHTHADAHSSGDERERSAAVLAFHSSVGVARVLLQCGVDTLVNASERNVNLRVSGGL